MAASPRASSGSCSRLTFGLNCPGWGGGRLGQGPDPSPTVSWPGDPQQTVSLPGPRLPCAVIRG